LVFAIPFLNSTMKITTIKQNGKKNFNMRNKAPTRRSINRNQKNGNKFRAPEFGQNMNTEPQVSESSDEFEEEVIEELETSSDNSNELNTNESEDEVEESESENEVEESSEGNGMENGTKIIEKEDIPKILKQKIKPSIFAYINNPEKKYKHEDRTIRIHNLPASVKAKHLLQLFSIYGKIEEVAVSIHSNILSKYYALILFETKEAAEKSLEATRMLYQGRFILVILLSAFYIKDDNDAVCVPLIPGVKLTQVVIAMESFGIVKNSNSHTTLHNKYVFVNYESPESVELALAAKEITVDGHKLNIKRVFSELEKMRHQKCEEVRQKRIARLAQKYNVKRHVVKTGFVQKAK